MLKKHDDQALNAQRGDQPAPRFRLTSHRFSLVDTPSPACAQAPLRLVLDTNVVLALWLFKDPRLAALQRYCLIRRSAILLVRSDTLDELRAVLAYTQFGLDADAQQQLYVSYATRTTTVPTSTPAPSLQLPRCTDEDDQKFIELAVSGDADYLLTRDRLLLKAGRQRQMRARCTVLTPEKFAAGL